MSDQPIVDAPIPPSATWAAPASWPTITYDTTGLLRWVENMSAAGRRQVTRVAIAMLDDWTHGHNKERPARGELKAWFAVFLADHRALQRRAADAERDFHKLRVENGALTAQRDAALEGLAERRANSIALDSARQVSGALDRCRVDLDDMRRHRDQLQALVESRRRKLDAVQLERDWLQARVKTLDEDRTRRTRERDTAERNLHERTVEMTKAYEHLRGVYDQAEVERNKLARSRGNRWRWDGDAWHRLDDGRASCSHTPGGGAK